MQNALDLFLSGLHPSATRIREYENTRARRGILGMKGKGGEFRHPVVPVHRWNATNCYESRKLRCNNTSIDMREGIAIRRTVGIDILSSIINLNDQVEYLNTVTGDELGPAWIRWLHSFVYILLIIILMIL